MMSENDNSFSKFDNFNEALSNKNSKDYIENFFSSFGHLRTYTQNSSVFRYNDTPDEAYVVESGKVRIYNLTLEGKEVTFKVISPGGILGLAEVFLNCPRLRYAETISTTKLWVLSREELIHHLSSNNELCLKILWILHQRVLQYQLNVEDLAVLSVRDRIAKLLVRLCKEQGEYTIIDFPFTHEEIAQMVGSSRQRVTITLNEMRKEGIISWKQKKIIIHSWMKLIE